MTDADVVDEIMYVLRHTSHQQVVECLGHAADALLRHIASETDEVCP